MMTTYSVSLIKLVLGSRNNLLLCTCIVLTRLEVRQCKVCLDYSHIVLNIATIGSSYHGIWFLLEIQQL